MRNIQVNIFDTDLVWRGMVEEVESLIHRHSFNDILYSEMVVSKTAANFDELQNGRILIVNNQLDKALVIEEISVTIPEQFVKFTLMPLKGILSYRILYPDDSTNFISKNQTYVMTELVRQQLISQVRDPNRHFTKTTGENILMAESPPRLYGDIIDYYTTEWIDMYLSDIVTQISKMRSSLTQLGWNIYIRSDYSDMVFDTYQGTDRTIDQIAVPPVIFSTDFGNIEKIDYFESIKDFKNHVYVIYEDANEIISHTETSNTDFGDVKSFNRKEIILESNQETEASALLDGKSEANKRPKIKSFSTEVIDNPNTMSSFQKDWFLGDIVTIQLKEFGVQLNSQVLEVEEIYANNAYTLNVTFSQPQASVLKLIKNALQLKRKSNY